MKKYLYILILMLLLPVGVNAGLKLSSVKDYGSCVDFQKSYISDDYHQGYYGFCKRFSCPNGYWYGEYLDYKLFECSNGNQDPKKTFVSGSCGGYNINKSCNSSGNTNYCGEIYLFDCSLTSSGTVYIAPTKPTTKITTKKTTTKRKTTKRTTTIATTTTTTTMPILDNNNFLKSLKLSVDGIVFSKDVLVYDLVIKEDVTKIDIEAVAESEKATVTIENNEVIDINKPILINVVAESGEKKIYTINLKYEEKEDDNNKISSIEIEGYNLNFDPDVTSYTLKVKKKVESLIFDIETESEKAEYEISGNKDLKNKSKIVISVTAENGDVLDYNILIKKSGNFGLTFIIIMVLGIAGFIGYKIINQMPMKKEDDNYDYE